MTTQPKLASILMPVYDGDHPVYLRKAIESILSQTYKNLEFLIIQDGVTRQQLLEVIQEYQDKYPIIRVVGLSRRSGIVAALNLGIDCGKGEYFVRMDADDMSLPERIEKQIAYLEARPELQFVSSFQDIINENDEVVGEYVTPITWEQAVKVMPWKVPFGHPSTLFRRSFFARVGKYRDIPRNQDTDLWFRAYLANAKGENIPEHLYQTRRSMEWAKRKGSLKVGLADFRIRRYYVAKGNFPWYACLAPYVYFAVKLIPPSIFDKLYIPLHSTFILFFKSLYHTPTDH